MGGFAVHFCDECTKIGHLDGQILTFYKVGVVGLAKKVIHNHNTQHTNTTTNQNDPWPPTPQQLCPLLPWQQPPQPQLLVRHLPTSPYKACAGVFGGALVGSFIWSASAYPIKNRAMGMALALSGRNLKERHNNQPSGGHGGGGEHRETMSHHLGRQMETWKIIKIQNMVAFIGLQLVAQNTTTNQKQAGVMKGSKEGICNKQDAWGERDAIILGAL